VREDETPPFIVYVSFRVYRCGTRGTRRGGSDGEVYARGYSSRGGGGGGGGDTADRGGV